MIKRKKRKVIKVGDVYIGGNHPIVIQSMTSTLTKDVPATIKQINQLSAAGAQLVRTAVLDFDDATALNKIIAQTDVPIIADIHFDDKLALESIKAGVAGLRLNPGNIKEKDKVELIVKACQQAEIPIRIGVNSGSLDRKKYTHTDEVINMVHSALDHIQILEDLNFYDIKVSLKSSSIINMVKAYRLFSEKKDYPLHVGVTEAGTTIRSAVRSSIGIGSLLLDALGDNIRVSVAGDPVKEMNIAKEILVSLGLKKGIKWIACPTCGRVNFDVEKVSLMLENQFSHVDANLSIAVMGCIVNGPGEAKDADIAVVGGKEKSIIYMNGQVYKTVEHNKILATTEEVIMKKLAETK